MAKKWLIPEIVFIAFSAAAVFTSCKMPVEPTEPKNPGGVKTVLSGGLSISLLGEAPAGAKIRAYDNPELTGEPSGEADIVFASKSKVLLPSQKKILDTMALSRMASAGQVNFSMSKEGEEEGDDISVVIEEGEAAQGSYELVLYPTGKGTFYYFELVVTDDGSTWVAKPYGKATVDAGENQTLPQTEEVVEFAGEDILAYEIPEYTIEEEIIAEGRALHQVPWKVLWYIIPRVEVDGNKYTRMTLSEIVAGIAKARDFERTIESWTHGILDIKMKPYVSKSTVIRFSGSVASMRFDRGTVPEFDMQEIGNIDSFDTYISTAKYGDGLTGNALPHGDWAGMNYGRYGRSMTILHSQSVEVFIHEWCHQLEAWYGRSTIAPSMPGGMPGLHDNAAYRYLNESGQLVGYGSLMDWYKVYVGGKIKHLPAGNEYVPNPTEHEGVHWYWWPYTPTKPDGWEVILDEPVENDDPANKITVKGTLSVWSITAVEEAVISAYTASGVKFDERTLHNFDNSSRNWVGTLEARRAGYTLLLPKQAVETPLTLVIRAKTMNGYEHTFTGDTIFYDSYYAGGANRGALVIHNTDIPNRAITVAMPSIKIGGSITGIVTADMNKVGIGRIRVDAFDGEQNLGYQYADYRAGRWEITIMPYSVPRNITVKAVADMIIGENIMNANGYAIPPLNIAAGSTDVLNADFPSIVIPLITLSGTIRVNSNMPINRLRLQLDYDFYWDNVICSDRVKICDIIPQPANWTNTDIPWQAVIPATNQNYKGQGYPVIMNLFAGFDGFEGVPEYEQHILQSSGVRVSMSDIGGINLTTEASGRTISGTMLFNCKADNGAKIERVVLEAYAIPTHLPRIKESLRKVGTFTLTDSGAGLQNVRQNWNYELLTGLVDFIYRVVEVSGPKIVFHPSKPVATYLSGVPGVDFGGNVVSGIELPPVKIWTDDEVLSNNEKILHIGGHHTSLLDGIVYNNNENGQFGSHIIVTTDEGRDIAWNAAQKQLDISKLTGLNWSSGNHMNADGWSLNTPALLDGTSLRFFVVRDGVYYEAPNNPFSVFRAATDDPNVDVMAFIDIGQVDMGWQKIYVEGTIGSVNFNTDNWPGRNRGVIVYAYWDAAYTQLAAVCTVDMATKQYSLQKPLSDAGKTLYLTFVAYVIDDQNVQVKTGWFKPTNGQFNVPLTAGGRIITNFTSIYIPDNGLWPNE